jgi:hypothetical protein
VQLVLPESNGEMDVILEEWTDEQIASCVAGAYAGMLAVQSHFPSMPMHFVFKVYERAETKFEAIKYDMTADDGWLTDVTLRLDPTLPTGSPVVTLHAFNIKAREQYGTDFVFTGFAVNSENAPGHVFHGAYYTAYATLGGPYNVTPFPAGRDPNGIGDQLVFSQIFQHETGHIFWALDEYEALTVSCGTRRERTSADRGVYGRKGRSESPTPTETRFRTCTIPPRLSDSRWRRSKRSKRPISRSISR